MQESADLEKYISPVRLFGMLNLVSVPSQVCFGPAVASEEMGHQQGLQCYLQGARSLSHPLDCNIFLGVCI